MKPIEQAHVGDEAVKTESLGIVTAVADAWDGVKPVAQPAPPAPGAEGEPAVPSSSEEIELLEWLDRYVSAYGPGEAKDLLWKIRPLLGKQAAEDRARGELERQMDMLPGVWWQRRRGGYGWKSDDSGIPEPDAEVLASTYQELESKVRSRLGEEQDAPEDEDLRCPTCGDVGFCHCPIGPASDEFGEDALGVERVVGDPAWVEEEPAPEQTFEELLAAENATVRAAPRSVNATWYVVCENGAGGYFFTDEADLALAFARENRMPAAPEFTHPMCAVTCEYLSRALAAACKAAGIPTPFKPDAPAYEWTVPGMAEGCLTWLYERGLDGLTIARSHVGVEGRFVVVVSMGEECEESAFGKDAAATVLTGLQDACRWVHAREEEANDAAN